MKHFLITLISTDAQHIIDIGEILSRRGYQTTIDGVVLPLGVFYIKRPNKETYLSIRREILGVCQSLLSEKLNVGLVVAAIDGVLAPGYYQKTELEMIPACGL